MLHFYALFPFPFATHEKYSNGGIDKHFIFVCCLIYVVKGNFDSGPKSGFGSASSPDTILCPSLHVEINVWFGVCQEVSNFIALFSSFFA